MNLGEIHIWESSNLLLLLPVVIGLVMPMRCQSVKRQVKFSRYPHCMEHLIFTQQNISDSMSLLAT
jgi:hypothetical protein